MVVLLAAGPVFLVGTVAAEALGRLSHRAASGCSAAVNAVYVPVDVLLGDRATALLNAGVAALCAWLWWRGGGGGGTRRRLKALRARFRGARRTAPVLTRAVAR